MTGARLNQPVFPDVRGGFRDPANVRRELREARGEGTFAWITSHTFRKTAATILDEAALSARLVADQVRGLHIDRARALLQFSSRSAARDIAKLIDSAASNAENNHDLVADDMKVAEITVDEGPTLRRYRPRALGRATRINKRTSHISIALMPGEED